MANQESIPVEIQTIFLTVGPSGCGKSTFCQKVLIPHLQEAGNLFANGAFGRMIHEDTEREKRPAFNVQYLSSDEIRRELLGINYDRYDQSMLDVSADAFKLLRTKLEMATSWPINAEFVVLDSTGLSEEFRDEIRELAAKQGYRVHVLLFDFKNRNDYFTPSADPKIVSGHLDKLRTQVIRTLTATKYHRVTRIRGLFDPIQYDFEITNFDRYSQHVLPWSLGTRDVKYVVIGDIHECIDELQRLIKQFGFVINETGKMVESADEKYTLRFVLVGDYLDKGHKTAEILDFLTANRQWFFIVRGNHERYVFRYFDRLRRAAEAGRPAPPDPKGDHFQYFSSIQFLKKHPDYLVKANQLYETTVEFLTYRGLKFKSFIVTHAPCKARHLGKMDKDSLDHQCVWYLKRDEPALEQLEWLRKEAVFNQPRRIFGHLAFQTKYRVGNIYGIDTGCIHGGALCGMMPQFDRPVFKFQPFLDLQPKLDEPTIKTEVLKNVRIDELTDGNRRRLNYMLRNGINYVSGTMCPADKDVQKQELESLEVGLRYYQSRGHLAVVLEPKFMGSRCQLYLNADPAKCYGVSRNGYKINQVDLTPVITKMLSAQYFGHWFERAPENTPPEIQSKEVEWMIIDGELMPWAALGEGLIEKQFRVTDSMNRREMAFLEKHGFETVRTALVADYEASDYERDRNQIDKKAMAQKYEANLRGTYAKMRQIKRRWQVLAEQQAEAKVYSTQLDIYGSPGELAYMPFNILKVRYTDGTEILPSSNLENLPEGVFPFTDQNLAKANHWDVYNICVSRPTEPMLLVEFDGDDWLARATKFFTELTTVKKMEGVVVKPLKVRPGEAPFLKVRNPEYLTLVYGHDYRFEERYDRMFAAKSIKSKLKMSIEEWELAQQMLAFPMDQINPENLPYRQLLANFLYANEKEGDLDPKL